MKAIIGLGNPGSQYEWTRHNVGFLVIDEMVNRWAPGEVSKSKFNAVFFETALNGEKLMLLKPMTFMNRSGQTVAELVRFYQMDTTEDVLVVVDDVALPLGDIRIRPNGSSGTHNGLADIENRLGSREYARLRLGIGDPGIVDRVSFVLGRFPEEQRATVRAAVRESAEACECWVKDGVTDAMNRFNTPRRKEVENPTDGTGTDRSEGSTHNNN